MKIIKQYLAKQGKIEGIVKKPPSTKLGLVVVIPAYKEENIESTLGSLLACELPSSDIEVIIYVNGRMDDDPVVREANEACYEKCVWFVAENSSDRMRFHCFMKLDHEKKRSGVGRARKKLMDEALFRFSQVSQDGVIANLDADCTVAANYLQEVYNNFKSESGKQAISIHFEHPLDSEAIIDYELHLRYFIGMQKYYGFPFAYQTVGSSMAARASGYAAVGGMNQRQAGEDFYFLHKFIKNNTCGELHSTTVYPSGRISDRVPFGTGKAVGEITRGGQYKTYSPESFAIISGLNTEIEKIYLGKEPSYDARLLPYLQKIKYADKVDEIRENTTDRASFTKRFYQFFDAFQLMKALHYLRDSGLEDIPISAAVKHYMNLVGEKSFSSALENCRMLRTYAKSSLTS